MSITNPYYKLKENDNIFQIRQNEYEKLEETIREMLKPVEELGFLIKEFRIKDARISTGQLHKTLKKHLVIHLQKGNSEINLSMDIPKLIDRNYIFINGRKKIPLFQLFDIPIVTRGKTIKLRTNVATLVLSDEKESPFIYLTILGKKVPFALILLSYFGPEVIKERFNLESEIEGTTLIDRMVKGLKDFYKEHETFTKEDYIKSLGKSYSSYNAKEKGEDVVFALDLIPKVDIMSCQFLETGSILEELIMLLQKEEYDDTDFRNKRIRCFEYVVISKIAKAIFDLCMSNRTTLNPKFNVNSSQIISECNVSDIVQFDFAINPIDELTKLTRTSLVGPGGFNRENVPEHLRDIHPTMFGRVCPVDTSDRENCGVLTNLVPNCNLDSNLRFSENVLEKQPISIPVSFVPFLEHDDQTRLQMAASQMRQSIMLTNFDQPMIQSGCEGLYTDQTQFIKIAKDDGEVVYVDNKFIIVIYNNKETDVFDINYRKIYVENLDVFKVYVKVGDKVKKGDILAESMFCRGGKINFGKNLLTAIMIYYGYNYEDGIVISDKLIKDNFFTSAHYRDLSFILPPNKVLMSLSNKEYKPIPEVYDKIEAGNSYARIKEIPTSVTDYCTIFEEEVPLLTEKEIYVTESNIYANEWNTDIPEFSKWVEKKIEEQKVEEKLVRNIFFEYLPKEQALQLIREKNLDKFSGTGKYRVKQEKVNGILIELYGLHFRRIELGDKVSNRHGNKGVIASIVPEEQMPTLEDGRHVDICVNPLGIISRMNIGQLFELHLSQSLYDLKKNMLKMLENKEDQEKIKSYLLEYIDIVDNTQDKWYYEQFKAQLPDVITEEFINDLVLIQPPFESVNIDGVKKALEYTGTNFKYELYEPIAGRKLEEKVAVGYVYWNKMVHIAEERLAARGIGSYARRTLQPLGGRKNKGGQKCGEMETACFIAHDAVANLNEMLTTKSDCIDLKNRYLRNMIETDLVREETEDDSIAESVKLLNSLLTSIGIERE